MILALLLAADLCASVTDIVHTAPDAFQRIRGSKREESAKTISWKDPVRIPGADRCRVIEFKDGAQPFYGCEMAARNCPEQEKKFEEMARELSGCIGEAKRSGDEKKRTAFFHPHAIPVRLQLQRGATCELRFFIEPLK